MKIEKTLLLKYQKIIIKEIFHKKRMEVIKRHIFQFQEKEENIIKELNNIVK